MFQLLSRVLLWLLLAAIAYTLFQKWYPSGNFVSRFGLGIVIAILALAFLNPGEPAVASLWRLISFPLKPLGAVTLMLFLAAKNIKDGGIGKPGGYLLGWSLAILLLSSTPAIAYFLVRSPAANVGSIYPADNTSTVVIAANNTSTVSDIPAQMIISAQNLQIPSYLLQNPQQINNRGLRVEDFVPNAETLQLTTQVWESYLNQIYIFLRGRP
ncbi:hypothetical protein H6F32_14000 [Anabaena sp. FACHB-1237]|uniref:hypothetical protein n=1 Tax=Anabaena sp. FACHB-1237 TaxID=2692769 RepID=UPI00167FF451|nr:hypothetical protein [Anabaena sp. FACHB-1237]MBD2138672.1 hypothetical protein [Anabaena sp. FACHB-1237]